MIRPDHARSASGRGERGAALLIVLWMLLLLSLLAAAFISTSRSDLQIARNDVDGARARELADAGVTRAIVGLNDPDPNLRWRIDGTPYRWQFGGGTIIVAIVDEAGKIDLNAAPAEVFASLFRHAGADAELSQRLSAAVSDRRAEARNASAAGEVEASAINANGPPFTSVTDLRNLPGLDAALYQRVARLVTVYSQLPTVDPASAPREVLLSLPGADSGDIDAFLAARAATTEGEIFAVAPPAQLAPYLAPASTAALSIRATATTESGATFVRDAVVLLHGNSGAPFVIKQWSRGIMPDER